MKVWSIFSWFSLLLLCSLTELVAAQGSSKWLTLSGNKPVVVARGGFSGIFPDSSFYAYTFTSELGIPNLQIWCDIQLTKDGVGICFPDIKLNNASSIDTVYEHKHNTYIVNGVPVQGWFSVDFTLEDLADVTLKQGNYNRSPQFDKNALQILTVDNVANLTSAGLWLNIPHDEFFRQHNLSMRSFVISASKQMTVNFISSPEVGFLRSIESRFKTGHTRLIFQFLGRDDVEPSTNQTYNSLMKNLTFIKTIATGVLVPKNYIWPVDSSSYLLNYTSLVLDAHKEGLEVFAYNFVNDAPLPYDYSYDPVAEYLSFIDNGVFSVDGVVSDFPITAYSTIDCFSHLTKNETVKAKLLIISSEGASGDYPGCSDKAYAKAVSDGVDILDCPVQLTSDGIPFCLGSINLIDRTNVGESNYSNLATTNPDLKITDGIFTYQLTWSQIQILKPAISNTYSNYSLNRNPRAGNDGKFMQLSDFLAFASNASSVSGVLISIENAAYLAEDQGLGVTDAVLDALKKTGYNNQTSKKIMIESRDSAVLSKFKGRGDYELVYLVDEDIRDIMNSTILELKEFANSVVVSKRSVFPKDKAFLTGETSIVPKLHDFNLQVYVQLFQNEFVSQPWDFYSDAYVEINTHFQAMGIDGVITDYPATAAKFKRNRCLGYKDPPQYTFPVHPGDLIRLITPSNLPPAEAPSPILTESDVVEPPLPPVTVRPPTGGNEPLSPGPSPRNSQPKLMIGSTTLNILVILLATFIC